MRQDHFRFGRWGVTGLTVQTGSCAAPSALARCGLPARSWRPPVSTSRGVEGGVRRRRGDEDRTKSVEDHKQVNSALASAAEHAVGTPSASARSGGPSRRSRRLSVAQSICPASQPFCAAGYYKYRAVPAFPGFWPHRCRTRLWKASSGCARGVGGLREARSCSAS